MPGEKPDLTIPIKMSGVEALLEIAKLRKQLEEIGTSGKKIKPANDELGWLGSNIQSVTKYATGMVSAMAGLKLATETINAINQGTREAADAMAKMSKEFSDFRNKVAGTAGIQGEAPSNKFTLEQIRLAEQAKVAPTKYAQVQEAMNETIQGNIGQQLTQDQADMLTQKVAQFSEARDIDSGAISKLIGSLTDGIKEDEDAYSTIMDRFGKLIDLLDASKGKVETLLPEFNEITATGTDWKTAGELASIYSRGGRPGEVGTKSRALGRAISQHLQSVAKGDAEDLGVTKDMKDTDAANQIYKRMLEDGVDPENKRDVDQWLAEQGWTAQEQQEAIQGYFNLGIRGKGLQAAQEMIRKGGAGAIEGAIEREQTSDRGKKRIVEGTLEANRLRRGMEESDRDLALTEAEAQLTKEGSLDEYTWGDAFQDTLVPDILFGDSGDFRTRKINDRATENLKGQVRGRLANNETGAYLQHTLEERSASNWFQSSIGSARAEQNDLIETLKNIERNTSRFDKPLVVPPANPTMRLN